MNMKIKDHNYMEFYNTIRSSIFYTPNYKVGESWTSKFEIVSLVNWYQKRVHEVINVMHLIISRLKHRARQEPMPNCPSIVYKEQNLSTV